MTINQQMFLYAVEEMSFTKAAKRAYVTQQCLSDHIRRLEESYMVTLFQRTPRLELTQAGQLLYQTLCQIRLLERDVANALNGTRDEIQGVVTVGISASRSKLVIPKLFHDYRQQYPNVRLSVVLEQTQNLLALLLQGKIDLFLGINCPAHPLIEKRLLVEEAIYLTATRRLLETQLPSGWASNRNRIKIGELAHLSLAFNPQVSTIAQTVERFLDRSALVANTVCSVGDYATQLSLCRLHQVATFCPEGFLGEIIRENQSADPSERIRILKVEGLTDRIQMDVVTNPNRCAPPYIRSMETLLGERYAALVQEIRAGLQRQ